MENLPLTRAEHKCELMWGLVAFAFAIYAAITTFEWHLPGRPEMLISTTEGVIWSVSSVVFLFVACSKLYHHGPHVFKCLRVLRGVRGNHIQRGGVREQWQEDDTLLSSG